jgi:hypothetical protein
LLLDIGNYKKIWSRAKTVFWYALNTSHPSGPPKSSVFLYVQETKKWTDEQTDSQQICKWSVPENQICCLLVCSSVNFFGVLIDRFGFLRISVVVPFCVPDLP